MNLNAGDDARRMHWDSIHDRHQRAMYSAMDDLAQEMERARRLTSPSATDLDRSLISSSAARIRSYAATFAEHAFALDAMREVLALVTFPDHHPEEG